MPGFIILLALGGMAALLQSNPDAASAGLNQGAVVPEAVRRDVPVVLDGEVRAHAKVGDRIFVGGDFQEVELPDGTVITQPYLFAYDVNTGVLDPNFRPLLNKSVRALEPTPQGDGLYVGGQFTRWEDDGGLAFPLRIAKLDASGALDTNFSASASAQVLSIAATGSDVYIGGNFLDISGVAATGLAKLDAGTGAVDTGLVFDIGATVKPSQYVQRVKVTPNGESLFVLHYGSELNGVERDAVAKLDLTGATPVLTGWQIDLLAQTAANPNDRIRQCANQFRDLAISPDGSFLVIAGQGNDVPPNCDSVLKYPTAGDSLVTYDWSARMYSSVFSLAVSDVAIYVGGHFCAAPANPIEPGGISSDYPLVLALCNVNDPLDPINPSVQDENAVFRAQMAALDPATGQALDWDPGSNNFVAVWDLTLIDRGLLAGHDADRFNDSLVGRSGFFDFGIPEDTEAPVMTATTPAAGTIVDDATSLAGTASDNRGVISVTLRLKNITTGQWLQEDGTFGPIEDVLPVTLTDIGLGEVEWSAPVSDLPSGDYEVRVFAVDAVGNTSDTLISPFTVPGSTGCSVALDEDDVPVITYNDFLANGVTEIQIRRNSGWLASANAGSGTFIDATATPGDYSYEIRWRPAGSNTDVTCSPGAITVPEGGGGVNCSVGLDVNGDPIVTWSTVPGVNSYVLREAGLAYIATISGGATTYTDTGRAPGDYEYTLRYRQNGATVDLACAPSPITVPDLGQAETCTASVTATGEVQLNWTEVAGEDSYQVRDDDGWVATVGSTSHLDPEPVAGDRSYYVRYRIAGVTTDIPCSPDPIVVP